LLVDKGDNMKAKLWVLAVAGALAAGGAWGQGTDVLKAKGCLNCHDMDKKKVGPSFKDLAAKYKGKQGAEGELVAKLKSGKGHPKSQATEADLQAAVRQALAAK
jgi:cytochrome c551/c552